MDVIEIIQASVHIEGETVHGDELGTAHPDGAYLAGRRPVRIQPHPGSPVEPPGPHAVAAKQADDGWFCYLNGGRVKTDRELFAWVREGQERGAGEILFTSMGHDGAKQGYANEALARMSALLSIPVIASGGAGCMEDFRDVFIEGKADAALAASVFHFSTIKIPELKLYLCTQNIPIRL